MFRFYISKFFKSFVFSIGMFIISSPLHAQANAAVGTTTADILKINQGTRPDGMAGTYTAMGDDAYSVNYNPAGLSWLKATQIVLLHLDSLADIQYEYLTFATAWGSGNVLAVNATYRHSPPIDNVPGISPVYTDDLLGSASYARRFSANFRGGVTLKYLKSTLAQFTGTAVACDLGVQLDKLPLGMRAGLSVQNLGTGMTFNPSSSADPLPLFIRAGLGTHQVIDKTKDLNIAIEVFKPSDQDFKVSIGGEFWVFPELFAVRAGYKLESLGALYGGINPSTGQPFQGVPNAFQNYSLGCSLTRRIEGDDFSIDVAYNPADFTSTTQDTLSFALNFKFNQLRIF